MDLFEQEKLGRLKKIQQLRQLDPETFDARIEKMQELQKSISEGITALNKVKSPVGLEPELKKLNERMVQLITAVTAPVKVKNISEAKAEPLKAIKILNQIEIPSWLKNNKELAAIGDGLVKTIEQNAKILNEIKAQGDSKQPSDFIPFRRVIKQGNGFIFDDTWYHAGGGGGATGTTNGLTDAQLRASAVPVSMASDIEIGAVELKNGTDDTRATVTASNELKVLPSAQPGVDIGDVTINNAAGAAAVNVQDGGNSLTVDYATTGSGTATGALRVELPTNGTGVIATVGAVTAISNALPAGANAIGKLAANSGVNIGDVGVTSVVPGTAATNLGKAVDAATGATDTGIAPLIKRVDTPTTVTPAANDYMNQHGDKYGNLYTVQGAFEVGTPFNAIENDVDISVKASAGYLKSVQISNYNAARRYFQIHNKATAPSAADVPVLSIPIPIGAGNSVTLFKLGREDWGEAGYFCSTGISVGISTTAGTFTAATTTDHVVSGVYV